MSTKRTVREITLVVETHDLSDRDHDKRVSWAEENVMDAVNKAMDQAFVAVVIDQGDGTRFVGIGTPTEETREMIEDLTKDG